MLGLTYYATWYKHQSFIKHCIKSISQSVGTSHKLGTFDKCLWLEKSAVGLIYKGQNRSWSISKACCIISCLMKIVMSPSIHSKGFKYYLHTNTVEPYVIANNNPQNRMIWKTGIYTAQCAKKNLITAKDWFRILPSVHL